MNSRVAYFKKYHLWLVFFIYLLGLGVSIYYHELWGDEVHSWNIARSTSGLTDLINNTRYEGHPPVWYFLLFILSRFTHDPGSIQYLQFFIAGLAAYFFLFKIKLSFSYKLLILFGYYYFYEYGVFSRNYAIGILFSCAISSGIGNDHKYKYWRYYPLLFLLSNTHFLAFLLALSFHFYVLWQLRRTMEKRSVLALHALFGILVLLPALYFIFPPSSSGLNTGFWLKIWTRDQFFVIAQAPLKALCPLPAWWEYHSWNTNALLEAQRKMSFLKFINPLVSLCLVVSVIYILYRDKGALFFFSVNFILTLLFAVFFPLISVRYTGFIYVGFVLALSLSNSTLIFTKQRRFLLYTLLLFQVTGAFIAVKKDWQLPFSYGREIKGMSALVPKGTDLITDFATLNYVSAYLDKPIYCLEFGREKSFLLWDKEIDPVRSRDFYTQSISFYFRKRGKREVYFMTNASQHELKNRDTLLFKRFTLVLVDQRDRAIERYSNLFLYKINAQ